MDTSAVQATRGTRGVLAATAAGAVFEWYDFYLCIILAPYLPKYSFQSNTRRRASYPLSRPMRLALSSGLSGA